LISVQCILLFFSPNPFKVPMPKKNQKLTVIPKLVALSEVQRKTGHSPGRIIRKCAEVWIDFTPAEESYQWLGRRLTARQRDPLMPMNGICKITEDGQQALANRTMNYLKWKGFALVKDLTVETETGILIVSSLSKGTCPPIPTPKILVPEEVLEEFLEDYAEPYEMAPEVPPEKGERKVLKDKLDELLLEIMKSGVKSGIGVFNIIKREMNSTHRILLQMVGDRRQSFRWQKGRIEQNCTRHTLRNRISGIRQHFPELRLK
jgi:hypothetical protein